MRAPLLSWTELEGIKVDKYADEGMSVEALGSLMKLAQMKGKSTGELG